MALAPPVGYETYYAGLIFAKMIPKEMERDWRKNGTPPEGDLYRAVTAHGDSAAPTPDGGRGRATSLKVQ